MLLRWILGRETRKVTPIAISKRKLDATLPNLSDPINEEAIRNLVDASLWNGNGTTPQATVQPLQSASLQNSSLPLDHLPEVKIFG